MLLVHSTSRYAEQIINGSKDIAVTTTVLVATVFVAKYVKNKVIPLLEKYWSSDEPNSPRSTAIISDQKTLSGTDVAQQSSPCSTTANSQSPVVLVSTPENSSVGEHMQNNNNVSSNTSKSNKPEDSSDIQDSEYSSQDGAFNPDDPVITDDESDESDHGKSLIPSMTSQNNKRSEAPLFQPVNISGNNTHKPTTESAYSKHENDSLNNSSGQLIKVQHDDIVLEVLYSMVHVPFNMLEIRSATNDFWIQYDFENGRNYTNTHIERVDGSAPRDVAEKLNTLQEEINTFIKLLDAYHNHIQLIKSEQQVCVTTVEQLARLIIRDPDIYNKIVRLESSTILRESIKELSEYLSVNSGPTDTKMTKDLSTVITYTIKYQEPQNTVQCYIDFVKDITQVMQFAENTDPNVIRKITNAYNALVKSYRVYKTILDGYREDIEKRNTILLEALEAEAHRMKKRIPYNGLRTAEAGSYRRQSLDSSMGDQFIALEDEENVTKSKSLKPSSNVSDSYEDSNSLC